MGTADRQAYTVDFVVNGYYTGTTDAETVVTVSKAITGMITGVR